MYAYTDESPAIVRELLRLSADSPGCFTSLLGNHEHAHIGGRITRKLHVGEAAG